MFVLFSRVVSVRYKEKAKHLGIDGYIFAIDQHTLESTSEKPELDCYCIQQTKNQHGMKSCYLDGVVDVMPCFGKFDIHIEICLFSIFLNLIQLTKSFLITNIGNLNTLKG